MILTGIAESHFWYWINNNKKYNSAFRQLIRRWEEPILMHGLIIEWLDSICVYIELSRFTSSLKFEFWHYTISDTRGIHLNNHLENKVKQDSRHEATKQAILKANKIYNEKENR